MKALTVIQPWATLIALGAKQYETRSWKPDKLRRGDFLAIHAGKQFGDDELYWCGQDPFQRVLRMHDIRFPAAQLPRGKVLCICQFVDIFHTEDIRLTLTDQELAFGNYQPKRYAWQLEVVYVCEPPIPAAGQQYIWEWNIPATNGDREELPAPATVPAPEVPKIEQLRLL